MSYPDHNKEAVKPEQDSASTSPWTWNSIEILDSVPSGDLQTARRLWESIKDQQYDLTTPQCFVEYHRIPDAEALRKVFLDLVQRANHEGRRPVVHIESHGSPDGLTLANGDPIDWSDLQPTFHALNMATRNRLFIVVAACWGFSGIAATWKKDQRGASLRLLAGPAESTLSGDIEGAMKDFYSVLLKERSLVQALAVARKSESKLQIFAAENLFTLAWERVVRRRSRRNGDLRELTNLAIANAAVQGKPFRMPYAGIMKLVEKQDLHQTFAKFKRDFFMLGEFPEIAQEVEQLTLESVRTV